MGKMIIYTVLQLEEFLDYPVNVFPIVSLTQVRCPWEKGVGSTASGWPASSRSTSSPRESAPQAPD